MSRSRYVVYEERTPWPGWVEAVVWAGCLVPAVMMAREALNGVPGRGVGTLFLACLLALAPSVVRYLLGSLYVRVTRTSVVVGVGRSGLIERLVLFQEIRRMEPVRYSPIREFGGWGIRGARNKKSAWTIRGDRALVLHLRDGSRLYVGSPHPERLKERIEAVRRDRARSPGAGPAGSAGGEGSGSDGSGGGP